MSNKQKQTKDERLAFRLDRDRAARLREVARQEGGVSKLLFRLVDGYLKRRKVA